MSGARNSFFFARLAGKKNDVVSEKSIIFAAEKFF